MLIPLDGSEAAERVIPFALELGTPFGARYTALRVVSPLSWEVSPHSYDPYPAYASPLSREAVRRQLERSAAQVHATGAACAIEIIDGVSAAASILEYAHAHAVDVIAIGTEGAGRVRRMLLGSVTDKVVRGSDTPVLVCNARSVETGTEARREAAETAH